MRTIRVMTEEEEKEDIAEMEREDLEDFMATLGTSCSFLENVTKKDMVFVVPRESDCEDSLSSSDESENEVSEIRVQKAKVIPNQNKPKGKEQQKQKVAARKKASKSQIKKSRSKVHKKKGRKFAPRRKV